MRIRSPSESLSSALAPRTTVSRFPLYLANKIEKEVSGISAGVSLETFANAWLSVMTSEGFVPSFFRVSSSSESLVTIAVAPQS